MTPLRNPSFWVFDIGLKAACRKIHIEPLVVILIGPLKVTKSSDPLSNPPNPYTLNRKPTSTPNPNPYPKGPKDPTIGYSGL